MLTWLSQAASGIGKETALAYAEAGVKGLVLADINLEGAQGVAEESKGIARHSDYKALAIKLDISDEQSVGNLVAAAFKEFGRVDYAVNSAGVSIRKLFWHSPLDRK